MAQKYNTFTLAGNDLSINSTGQNISKLGLAKYFNNVAIKNGNILTAASGVDLFDMLDGSGGLSQSIDELGGIVGMQVFEVYNQGKFCPYLIICSADLKVYYCNLALQDLALVRLQDIQLTSKPIFETYISDNKNLLLISSATDEMWIWDGIATPLEVLNAPKVSSMAVGLERLFITCQDSPYKVYYSLDKDPSNWNNDTNDDTNGEISFVDNLGSVIKVFALDNYIFVIRQNGIIKIYATANQAAFKQSKLFVSTGKIYPNSICLAGDKIVFLTSEGLYSFDGLNAKKIATQVDDLFARDNEDCFAICRDNTYWISANVIDHTGKDQRACLEIDLNLGVVVSLRQIDCFSSFAIEHNKFRGVCLLVNNSNINGRSTSENNNVSNEQINAKTAKSVIFLPKSTSQSENCGEFLYFSNSLPLEPATGKKAITKIEITTGHKVNLQINSNCASKQITILPSEQLQTFVVNVSGDCFNFVLSGDGSLQLFNFTIYYTFIA